MSAPITPDAARAEERCSCPPDDHWDCQGTGLANGGHGSLPPAPPSSEPRREEDCPECGGAGEIEFWVMNGEEADIAQAACKTCKGTGFASAPPPAPAPAPKEE